MHNTKVGTKGEQRLLVGPEEAINFLELEDAQVLSTPQMILYMERTCRNTVLPLLLSGHDTVGTHVNVFHRAAAPIGSVVTFTSEITAVDDRRVQFKVTARTEENELIGEGTHERAIVNVVRFAAKTAQKNRRK
jgi:predicted thioesterase